MNPAAPLDAWLHPTVQAATVAGLVALVGWWVSAWQNRRRDARQRTERVEDVQRALLAEIRANHATVDRDDFADAHRLLLAALDRGERPLPPTEANDQVFRAIIDDIRVLPSEVIDPVIIYYRQLSVIAALAKDFRSLAEQDERRARTMLEDYLSLQMEAVDLGGEAIEALFLSLNLSAPERDRWHEETTRRSNQSLRTSLPGELAALRARLSRAGADPSGP